VVEVKRHILFGSEDDLIQILETDGCGSQINTSYIERDNLTSRHSNGRLVRKTLSHSKKKVYLQRHIVSDHRGTTEYDPARAVGVSIIAAHRITSSAWMRMVGGMVRPRAWAVFTLMTSSNFMGCSTGRSAGLAPFKILSTYSAARRYSCRRSVP
jgi:hypothetical protein